MNEEDRECQLASHITYVLNNVIPWWECNGIPLDIDRNKSDLGSTTKGYSRPDFVCRIKNAFILKREGKADSVENFKMAIQDLEEKFNRIDPLIFGDVNFIFLLRCRTSYTHRKWANVIKSDKYDRLRWFKYRFKI
ncbi:31198_t:CDS:2 [Gigaspora margarita]|uniref:31198_t:CDS:1 n=1 Tax=Gigaspora margarita TaxID=4874 RepID=A0ABN7UWQ5_GIGMA|nr:31198_t:CDS:2 [Gigaspora margarita]